MNNKLFAGCALIAVMSLAACSEGVPSSNEVEARATAQSNAEAIAEIGMPKIKNHTEKRLAVYLAELRDQPKLVTYTYESGMDGRKICLGKSIGYPMPYATQVTNPMVSNLNSGADGGNFALPQSEPNGLYSPASAEATWVVLIGPDGNPSPFYEEQRVSVSLFELTGPIVAVGCKH